jgi:hypothetical protein
LYNSKLESIWPIPKWRSKCLYGFVSFLKENSNTIFIRRFWIHVLPICIPFVVNWIVIQLLLNWISIQCVWIQIRIQWHLDFFLVPQGYIFSIFLILMQIRTLYCILHIASYHHYPLVGIHLYLGYFNM